MTAKNHELHQPLLVGRQAVDEFAAGQNLGVSGVSMGWNSFGRAGWYVPHSMLGISFGEQYHGKRPVFYFEPELITPELTVVTESIGIDLVRGFGSSYPGHGLRQDPLYNINQVSRLDVLSLAFYMELDDTPPEAVDSCSLGEKTFNFYQAFIRHTIELSQD